MLPDKDRERSNYNIKESSLGRLFIKILRLGPKSADALSLLEWKKPTFANMARAGDFPARLYEVFQKRKGSAGAGGGRLSVAQVLEKLDALSKETKA